MILLADATRLPIADESVDMTIGSPPYCDARTYDDGTLPEGHVVSRSAADWVEWMLLVTIESVRVTRGPVIWVCAGVTRDRNYWPAPEGLAWEWFRRGLGTAYRPVYWHRVGIPGSGGDQWFRADVEYCLCFKRPGPLPFSDNTACGHPPKWAPGGEMSYRLTDGQRVNGEHDPWMKRGRGNNLGGRTTDGKINRGTNSRDQWGGTGHGTSAVGRRANGDHKFRHTKRDANGDMQQQQYGAPVLANPGNAIDYCWGELDETAWLHTNVGGGQMGDHRAHENEAPYPEALAEFFIRSLCPVGGTVLDPFSGSGTTAAVAKRTHRKYIASDIRQSQCELTRRRLAEVQRELFA